MSVELKNDLMKKAATVIITLVRSHEAEQINLIVENGAFPKPNGLTARLTWF